MTISTAIWLDIDRVILDRTKWHPKRERCGLWFGAQDLNLETGDSILHVTYMAELLNEAEGPDLFEIYQDAVDEVLAMPEVQGLDLIGHWHTHWANSMPSVPDLKGIRDDQIGTVVCVGQGMLTWYSAEGLLHMEKIKRSPVREKMALALMKDFA